MDLIGQEVRIDERIYYVREKQVILDRDLAQLYGVETKVLNQSVKRNIERFPASFMFRLEHEEFIELVTNCDRFKKLKHSSNMPHAFTEQGVAMLSSVLRSPTAVSVSIRIMESFVKLRQFMIKNSYMFQRMNIFEMRLAETESKVESVMKMIDNEKRIPQQGIFFDGQIYDAYSFVADLVRKAARRIVLIDNYIDDAVYLIGASIKDLGKKWFGFTLMENTDAEELIKKIK